MDENPYKSPSEASGEVPTEQSAPWFRGKTFAGAVVGFILALVVAPAIYPAAAFIVLGGMIVGAIAGLLIDRATSER